VAAHGAALTALPAGLWRLTLVFGYHGGYTEQGFRDGHFTGWGMPYMIFLSMATELAALLTLGLVQPWGEVPPRWIPFVGGRTLAPKIVVRIAAAGAVILIALWTQLLFWWAIPHHGMTTMGSDVLGVIYLPLVAWGPLLAAVTVSYRRRHRP
jgi:hypothetical protein